MSPEVVHDLKHRKCVLIIVLEFFEGSLEHTGVLCHLKGIALNEIDRAQRLSLREFDKNITYHKATRRNCALIIQRVQLVCLNIYSLKRHAGI